MYNVTFGVLNSYTDLNLVLTGKEIPLPEPKTYVIDLPCADGQVDLSTALTNGKIKYNNREIKLFFTLMCARSDVETNRSNIANRIHGRVMNITLSEDPNFYFHGRCKIEEFNTDDFPATVTISIDAEPYRYKQTETTINVTASSSGTNKTIPEQTMDVVPTITTTSDMTLIYKSKQYSLFTGNNVIVDVVLSNSITTLTFKGSGTATIKFREGEL